MNYTVQKCELWRKTFGAVLQKYTVPEDWMYKEARRLFQEPEVTDPATLDVSTAVLCQWVLEYTWPVQTAAFKTDREILLVG